MQQPLALLTKNATIFWKHEVFIDCYHSNTAIYIFSVFFFKKSSKKCENNAKISVLILVLSTFARVILHVKFVNILK